MTLLMIIVCVFMWHLSSDPTIAITDKERMNFAFLYHLVKGAIIFGIILDVFLIWLRSLPYRTEKHLKRKLKHQEF
jgi:hypothetical protein